MSPRALSLTLGLALGAALAASAGDEANRPSDPGSPAAAAVKDTLDLVFFSEKRPVFLRLHVRVDGKSYEAVWLDAMRRLHKYMDVDGDGRLSPSERARGAFLQQLLNRARQAPAPARAMAAASPASGNMDNVATADELAEYLRPAFGPAQLQVSGPETTGPETLFVALDTDGDRRLTRAEVEAAEASLRKLDQDDDGTIQLQEMQPFRNPYFGAPRAMRSQPGTDDAAFAVLSPHESRTRLVRRLVSRYDRPELDSRLSREELGMDAPRFEQADGDGDGTLDTDELVRFLGGVPPDLELDVDVSRSGSAKVALAGSGSGSSAMAGLTRSNNSGGLDLLLDGVQLELNSGGRSGFPNARQFYQQQFRQADGDNNKYLDLKEAQQNGVFDAATFKLMDRDGDGKLFEKEMDDYVAQDEDTSASRTMISALDQGRSLFDVLDANRDRRLSVREIREVVAKLATWDRDGDGQVTVEEIPRHYQLGFGRGRSTLLSRFGFVDSAVIGMGYQGVPGGLAKGPTWFGKMDRNRDGDLSRREFLGSLAEFNRLDADHNGLLDLAEASKAK